MTLTRGSTLDLQKLYRANNKEYWQGLLPKDVVVEFSSLLPKDFIEGIYIPQAKVPWPRGCGPKPKGYTIRLHEILSDPRLWPVAQLSLLHAQVHLEGVLGNRALFRHGPAFNARMNHLANIKAFDPFW